MKFVQIMGSMIGNGRPVIVLTTFSCHQIPLHTYCSHGRPHVDCTHGELFQLVYLTCKLQHWGWMLRTFKRINFCPGRLWILGNSTLIERNLCNLQRNFINPCNGYWNAVIKWYCCRLCCRNVPPNHRSLIERSILERDWNSSWRARQLSKQAERGQRITVRNVAETGSVRDDNSHPCGHDAAAAAAADQCSIFIFTISHIIDTLFHMR